jgi:hypothetical protein
MAVTTQINEELGKCTASKLIQEGEVMEIYSTTLFSVIASGSLKQEV